MDTIHDVNSSSLAVIWSDGRQDCRIVNVSPRDIDVESNSESITQNYSFNIVNGNVIGENCSNVTSGINNAAFRISTDENISNQENDDNSLHCSSSSVARRRVSDDDRTSSNNASLEPTPCCSTSIDPASSSSSSNSNGHINPAFEMPNELKYDAVVKHSPVHPNVFLVRNRNSLPDITSCSCPTSDELILQALDKEIEDNLDKVPTSHFNTIEKRLHFLKRGTAVSPLQTSLADLANSTLRGSSRSSNERTEGEDSNEPPPPHYSSLRFMFLEDEPPKYQDVTGKKLMMCDPPKVQTTPTSKWKRRMIVVAVIIFIILIGALLVYACFVSGHPLGAYGSVPRKF